MFQENNEECHSYETTTQIYEKLITNVKTFKWGSILHRYMHAPYVKDPETKERTTLMNSTVKLMKNVFQILIITSSPTLLNYNKKMQQLDDHIPSFYEVLLSKRLVVQNKAKPEPIHSCITEYIYNSVGLV